MQTSLSKIVLPTGFVLAENKNPLCNVYLDWVVAIVPQFTDNGLRARFSGDFDFTVITYGNSRRPAEMCKSEEHVSRNSHIGAQCHLLREVVAHLTRSDNLQEGYDAFVYALRPFGVVGEVQELGDDIVRPIATPPDGYVWRLLAVVEKS